MIRKGNKVMFAYDGKEQKGIVIKGGKKKVKVRIIGTDIIIKGMAAVFREVDFRLPRGPRSIMDKWDVQGYKEFGLGTDGLIYRANITLDDERLINVFNDGGGGETILSAVFGGGISKVVEQMLTDAKTWVKQFGWEDDVNPFETWFDWNLDHRPFGVLAADYLKKQKEEWEKVFPEDKK